MSSFLRHHYRGAAVLLAWLAVVGWHVRREYFKPELVLLTEGSRSLAPGALFYVARMRGAAIGIATTSLDTTADGFLFRDVLQLDVPAMDTLHRAVAETRLELSPALSLRRFRFHLDSEVGRFEVTGRALEDSAIALQIRSGGAVQRSTLRLPRGTVLPGALTLRLAAAGRLREGAEYQVRLFDPSILAGRATTIRVLTRDTLIVPDSAALDDATGEWRPAAYDTVPVWHLEQDYGGVRTESWVDEDGRIIRETSPLGFTLERTEYELAQQEWARSRADSSLESGYGSVIESTAIASNVSLGDVATRDSLRVLLEGVDLSGFDLDGGRQRLRGDTLRIAREPASALRASYRLPYTGGGEPAEELGATPLIQTGDPRIRSTARRIAGGATDPAEVARRLEAWVYASLRKEITLSVPSAAQVLERRQGDCNEHTVLYVALARVLGLPARTAVGLVHVNGRFYYHAWPEVWLDGWVAVDPTLGQFPADASHVRFLLGGLARQVDLIRLIGRLRLEVL